MKKTVEIKKPSKRERERERERERDMKIEIWKKRMCLLNLLLLPYSWTSSWFLFESSLATQ
jgi:hypothetical protein